jgi:hypothetical protein
MEKEELIGEQPSMQMTQDEQTEIAQENLSEKLDTAVENGNNGSLGKFKDTNSLLDAYNNLQAEFTKKCQALSEITKKLEVDAAQPSALRIDNEISEIDSKNNEKEILPIYKREDWTQKVSDFLEKNKQARPYAKEIAEKILQDESLAKNESALDIAFAKTIASSAVLPETLVEDDRFVSDYVLKSEKVKNAVLQLYLKELKSNKVPNLMGMQNSSKEVLYGTKQATSLSQAKEIVKQMLT